MKLILQIAAGVLLALAILVLGAAVVERYEVYKLEQKMAAIKEERLAKEALKIRQAELSLQQKIEARKVKILEAQENRRKLAIQQQKNKAKHDAWIEFFEPREDCHQYQNDEHMVDCVEYRNKKKSEFESRYRAGL
ncbi:hypothetical protein [Shewanella subflava]|uniref:DUF2570 domain-containing protein n=1 Tax=Shewanella subflava TaxID=2986476 RepID=A0ABT3I5R2_9GAMM|nr:hypothetical protein [Shewanella subflava]MCW3171385.1 hypothetical protein [Shewanella subflava]